MAADPSYDPRALLYAALYECQGVSALLKSTLAVLRL